MKIKTSELSGVALDWAVAQIDEVKTIMLAPKKGETKKPFALFGSIALQIGGDAENSYSPSTCWHCGGPLIERFKIQLLYIDCDWHGENLDLWEATAYDLPGSAIGESMLIAACRVIVSAKLGDEVDVPEGLV